VRTVPASIVLISPPLRNQWMVGEVGKAERVV
jgi:hypothetical protein